MLLSSNLFKRLSQYATAGFAALALAACGGGGGSPGATGSSTTGGTTGATTGTASGNGKIQIVLVDSSGVEKNTVTSVNPLTAKAMVTDDKGNPVKDKIVTFSVGGSIATLSPSAGTALTDANGVAQVSLKAVDNTDGGADEIAASVTVGTAPVTATAPFTVGPSPSATPVAINFVSATPSSQSIVIQGAGGNGRTEVALLTFSVIDKTNTGVANQQVIFKTQSTESVALASDTGVTGADGKVTVALSSGTKPTTVRVIATVKDTSISAISDTVTVTTGQPDSAHFSLSAEKYYVEGLNHDGVEDKISVFLADKNGGAVADGTPVVFTVDGGAIVGDGGAKCLTVKGTCTVTWRSQNPRISTGLVTVIATSTNGTSNLEASLKLYASGSFGAVYKVTNSSIQGSTQRLTTKNGTIALDFTASCTAQTINIEVTDENGNPMPEGTTISSANAVNASMAVSPSTVAYGGLFSDSQTRGTVHSVTVTPSGCTVGGAKTVQGGVSIVVKSPLGSPVVTAPITLTFNGN